MYKSFMEMPVLLKFFTVHALACAFLIPGVLIPNNLLHINGELIPYSEIWSSGAAIFGLFAGVFLPYIAYLFLQKQRKSRALYVFTLFVTLIISNLVLNQESRYLLYETVFYMLLVLAIALYLFKSKSVISYIASNKSIKSDQKDAT